MVEATTSSRRSGSVLTVAISGEMDLAVGPVVEKAIDAAVATAGVNTVRVDLSEVPFLDSSGIGMLLKGRRTADQHRVEYQVIGAHGIAERILRLSGVWTHLTGDASEPTTS